MTTKNEKQDPVETKFKMVRPKRMAVSMCFEEVDPELVTVPGKSQSIQKLYNDFVVGKLDPSQIGGAPVYDPEGSSEVDPMNTFGLTLEQVDALRQQHERTIDEERKKRGRKTVANAHADTKQPGEGDKTPSSDRAPEPPSPGGEG